jgi:hypothetical protein
MMTQQEAIAAATEASRLRIGCEILHVARLSPVGLAWQGYAVWLRDELRTCEYRFEALDEAKAFLESRAQERAGCGR